MTTPVLTATLPGVPGDVAAATRLQLLGTCFAVWHDDFAVTAAHVVRGLEPKELHVARGPTPAARPYQLGAWPTIGETCALVGYTWEDTPADAPRPTCAERRGPLADLGTYAELGSGFGQGAGLDYACARLEERIRA